MRSMAPSNARAYAADADVISPWPQFQTPIGTEYRETPQTSSIGSHPTECRINSSSMERSEVIDCILEGCGSCRVPTARRSSALISTGVGGGSPSCPLMLTTVSPWDGEQASDRSP